MKDNLATSFRRALDFFREQARGEFATRLISDVLDPMADELDILSGEIENTAADIAAFESEIEGNNP